MQRPIVPRRHAPFEEQFANQGAIVAARLAVVRLEVPHVALARVDAAVVVVRTLGYGASVERGLGIADFEIDHAEAVAPRDVVACGGLEEEVRVAFLLETDVEDVADAHLYVAGAHGVDQLHRFDVLRIDRRDARIDHAAVDEHEQLAAVHHADGL